MGHGSFSLAQVLLMLVALSGLPLLCVCGRFPEGTSGGWLVHSLSD